MLLLIDNYDSFTYNLFHYLGELGAEVVVRRNDEIDVQAAMALHPSAILLSPGPCYPDQAGICLALIAAAAETRTPLIGVCLGHQAIGQAFGGKVVRAGEIVHGKLGTIRHQGAGVFRGLPSPFHATRYHSLIVERDSLPDDARGDRRARGRHDHGPRPPRAARSTACSSTPSSIASEHGHALLRNFLDLARVPA